MPRDVLDAEVERITDLGVVIEYNMEVANVREAMSEGSFDAAFLAVGAHIAKRATFRPEKRRKFSMLFRCCARWKARTSRCSAAASSSMAAATPRSTSRALRERLGADEAIIVYRRTRDRMPAHDFELEEALEEGVMMKWLSTIKRMESRSDHGRENGA